MEIILFEERENEMSFFFFIVSFIFVFCMNVINYFDFFSSYIVSNTVTLDRKYGGNGKGILKPNYRKDRKDKKV